MKTFLVILAAAGLASADIGLGYHYGPSKPQTSYGTPSYTVGSGSTGFNRGENTAQNVYQATGGFGTGFQGTGYQSGSGYQTGNTGYQSGTGYQTGNTGYQSGNGYQTGAGYQSGTGYQAGTGYQSGHGYQTGAGYQTTQNKYQTGGNYAGVSSGGSQHQSGGSLGAFGVSSGSLQAVQGLSQYQSSNQNYQQQYYSQVHQQPAQIFKHFYVHAAPEEPEAPRPRQPLVLPAPQKHYKIIFIKTPAPNAGGSQIVPVQQQNEEKTIVYVLVKKPEAAEDIVLPQIEQKPPSKPEVYFIKYKGKEDSQAVINNIVSEYNSGKESVNVANAVHSSGTIDSISDIKYTSQSVGNSQSAGNVQSVGNGADAVQVLTGSSGSQFGAGVGSVGQSLSSGSVDSGSSGSSFQSSFGTSTVSYPSSTAGYQVSTGAPIQVVSSTGGYDSGNSGFSSTGSSAGEYVQTNTISASQGIPHETYGTPNFRAN